VRGVRFGVAEPLQGLPTALEKALLEKPLFVLDEEILAVVFKDGQRHDQSISEVGQNLVGPPRVDIQGFGPFESLTWCTGLHGIEQSFHLQFPETELLFLVDSVLGQVVECGQVLDDKAGVKNRKRKACMHADSIADFIDRHLVFWRSTVCDPGSWVRKTSLGGRVLSLRRLQCRPPTIAAP